MPEHAKRARARLRHAVRRAQIPKPAHLKTGNGMGGGMGMGMATGMGAGMATAMGGGMGGANAGYGGRMGGEYEQVGRHCSLERSSCRVQFFYNV